MGDFWALARRMLRYRGTLSLAMVFAAVSAGGLGAGLLAIAPILRAILGREDSGGLREYAASLGPGWTRFVPSAWLGALPSDRYHSVQWVVLGLIALTMVGAVANFLHAYLSMTVQSRTVADIRHEAFERVLHLPLRQVVSGAASGGRPSAAASLAVIGGGSAGAAGVGSGAADLVSRIVYDTGTLSGGFNSLLSKAVAQMTKGAAALAVALVVSWPLTLAALLVAPVLATVMRKLGKRIRRASRTGLEAQAGLYHAVGETVDGMRVVKVHGAEAAELGRFDELNARVMRQEFRVRTARALASPLVESLAIVVLAGLALIAAKAIIDGELEVDRFILAFGSLGVAGAALRPLTGVLNDIQQSAAAARRLRELLGAAPEADGPGPELARHRSSLEFDAVSFTYPGAASRALDGFSATIRHGERVAFVGPNGSGKTTLLSLVPRLFEPDTPPGGGGGRILVDGTDIRGVTLRSLRGQIGVVTQETVLFRGSVRANIAYGRPGATDAEVRDAARRARAEEFILARPLGYDEQVGDRGGALSGGQRQRLAIARAILRDPAILILDEATSMIDTESESRINEALAEFARGRTTLIVAHRKSTILAADRIVVMDGGRLIDQGTHAELVSRCPLYRQLAGEA
ncbi:MAG: ATP-binding cassette domain-containing protein [Phycisphaerae bacterium]|nr:ATP-binding cassette domain-containing protein [Phycisphaerae bacterium]